MRSFNLRPRWRGPAAALLVALLATGCNGAEQRAFVARCDAPLRTRVEAALRAGSLDSLDVLGRADGVIDAARRERLAAKGASLGQVTGELFVARLRAGAVPKVAALDFVRSLQLSQTRPLAQ